MSTSHVGRGRVATAILSTQMLISGAVLVLIAAAVVMSPVAFTSPALFASLFAMFVLSGVAAVVPWDRVARHWGVALPLVNIVVIVALRQFAPTLGAGLLLVFPIMWLARTFRARETVGGVTLAIGLLWASRLIGSAVAISYNDFASLILLPIVLAFVASVTYIGARRTRAQRVLLRQHADLVEAALTKARRQEEVLDEVLNAVDFGVIAFDRDQRVTLVNRAQRHALADFGTPADAVVHPIVYQADRITPFTEAERPFTRAVAGQAFNNLTIWVGEPGGRRAAYATSSRILHTRSGEYDGGVIVLRDITAELEAVRARDDLVASVTHELRSPLTSILGYLDLARDDSEVSPETRRMLDVAYNNSDRLLVIVTDLLRAASDADRDLPMSFVSCDLAEIAAECVESHRLLADERDVDLKLTGVPHAYVTADPVRMRQVIDNLVTNAIKYNREWGAVTVHVTESAEQVGISVTDTGQGIPEGDLPRIFDRFFRTDSARGSAATGTGLGLAITREIMHRHGGELMVESQLGIGSTFSAFVPTSQNSAVGVGASRTAAS